MGEGPLPSQLPLRAEILVSWWLTPKCYSPEKIVENSGAEIEGAFCVAQHMCAGLSFHPWPTAAEDCFGTEGHFSTMPGV